MVSLFSDSNKFTLMVQNDNNTERVIYDTLNLTLCVQIIKGYTVC